MWLAVLGCHVPNTTNDDSAPPFVDCNSKWVLHSECISQWRNAFNRDDITVAIRIEVHLNPSILNSFKTVATLLLRLLFQTSLSHRFRVTNITICTWMPSEKCANVLFAWMNLICKCSCHRSSIADAVRRFNGDAIERCNFVSANSAHFQLISMAAGGKYPF